jgi:hypothetical protein
VLDVIVLLLVDVAVDTSVEVAVLVMVDEMVVVAVVTVQPRSRPSSYAAIALLSDLRTSLVVA